MFRAKVRFTYSPRRPIVGLIKTDAIVYLKMIINRNSKKKKDWRKEKHWIYRFFRLFYVILHILYIFAIIFRFEMLAEHNWQLRTYACWQMDLLRHSPQLSDNTAQTHMTNLSFVLGSLTKLLCMLVSQSFVVAMQLDPVLKTQHKFTSEVRLLIGDKLGIKQHLVNTNVTVKIISKEEARMLSTAQISEKEM